MKITRDDISQAFITFCGQHLSEKEILIVESTVETHTDLLAHILIETDFFGRMPSVTSVFKTLCVPVSGP